METRAEYPSDVTDEQWRILVKLLPPAKGRGRKPIDRRRVLNAILYVVRSGCQWRMLPSEFPCWSTVYGIFWKWRREGVWQGIHDALRERVRRAAGKQATPSAAIRMSYTPLPSMSTAPVTDRPRLPSSVFPTKTMPAT